MKLDLRDRSRRLRPRAVVALPNGFTAAGLPTTITFMGQLYEEGKLLALAKAYQDATEFEEKHPVL